VLLADHRWLLLGLLLTTLWQHLCLPQVKMRVKQPQHRSLPELRTLVAGLSLMLTKLLPVLGVSWVEMKQRLLPSKTRLVRKNYWHLALV
jgi:hypothetical protein